MAPGRALPRRLSCADDAALNRSIYSTFEKGELVVVPRSDGSHRFAQVTERKSEGYFRGEMQVGHQYTVLLEPRSPGAFTAV